MEMHEKMAEVLDTVMEEIRTHSKGRPGGWRAPSVPVGP